MKILPKISKISVIKIKIFLIVLGAFLILGPALEIVFQGFSGNGQEIPFSQEKLAILGETALLPISDPAAPEPKVIGKMPVIITAYSSSVSQTDNTPFVTAANTQVRDGIIANNYLPFGTRVRIPEIYGDKIFVVEDRMNKKKGSYQIDIWFSNFWEAKEFGAKKSYIEILEN